jgi:hypothetical protein
MQTNPNPKPEFLQKKIKPRTFNRTQNQIFEKTGTQIRTRSDKFWKPTNRTGPLFVAGLHLWFFKEFQIKREVKNLPV